MDALAQEIRNRFIGLFKTEPLLIRSPGRINLIGEHTDYNDGFVMPAAIDKEIIFAIARSHSNESQIHALKYDQHITVDVNNPSKVNAPAWANYLLGVLFQIRQHGYTVGPFNCVFGGNIPTGSGLSSSAALECGFGFALSELFHLNIPRLKIVTIGQWAEHNYVGVKCGIMDQYASVMGKDGSVILLDCRSLNHRYAPIDLHDHIIVLCDTKVKHALVDSEYNTRRSECEEGVRILKKHYPQIQSLRDASVEMVNRHKPELTGKIFDRCLYVVSEIERVQAATKDLEANDLVAFGKKMYETHDGLSKLYEVSCAELDFLVDEAKRTGKVFGARMMGGGFGGCTINILKESDVDDVVGRLSAAYKAKYNIDMPSYRVKIKDGTSILSTSTASV
ncbi:MAG TPA: galactokinase [Chryseosolibacter sp.]